jgi:hypothetical protein
MTDDEYNNLPPGFSMLGGLQSIERLIKEIQPKSVLEIGCFLGRTSVAICKSDPTLALTCVDSWNEQFIIPNMFEKFNITPETMQSEFRRNTAEYNITPICGNFLHHETQSQLENYDLTIIDVHRRRKIMLPVLSLAWAKTRICMSGAHYSNQYPIVQSVVNDFAKIISRPVHIDSVTWKIMK